MNQTSEGYARSAKGLADWLWKEIGQPKIMSQKEFMDKYFDSAQGIVFLDRGSAGVSHIDLFSKGATGSGFYAADKIWYWPLK